MPPIARTAESIKQQMLDATAADPILSAYLTSASRRSIFGNHYYIVAAAQAVHEQLWDVLQVRLETLANQASFGSAEYIRKKMFEFQYDPAIPQVVQLVDLIPQYPIIDENMRIITRCSVITTISGMVIVKLAKGTTPQSLDNLEVSAAQAYLEQIGIPGINYTAFSADPDQLFVEAQIYYNGQYSQVILANVKQAIANYCANIDFNGVFLVSDLELAIKAVTGVKDVLLLNVRTRDNATVLANAPYLVRNKTTTSRAWPTFAGWIIPETTAGSTLDDTLQLIPS